MPSNNEEEFQDDNTGQVNNDQETENVEQEDGLPEPEKARVKAIKKSIGGHLSAITKQEKEFNDFVDNIVSFNYDVASDLAGRVAAQKSAVAQKLQTITDIYEAHNVDKRSLEEKYNPVFNRCTKLIGDIGGLAEDAKRRRQAERAEFASGAHSMIEEPTGQTNRRNVGFQLPGNIATDGNAQDSIADAIPNRGTDWTGGLQQSLPMGATAASLNRTGLGATFGLQGQDGMPTESAAYQRAKKAFDPAGLFLPTPVFQGLTTEEQRSIEKMHVECLKKLPSIKLQTFSGKSTEDFERWRVHFKRVIDCQPTLSKAGKLTFLLQALGGRALTQIEEYTCGNFTDSAYDNAMSMLVKLYGGTIRENAKTQMRFNRTKPLQSMSASELSRVFIACSSMKDFLESQGNKYCLSNPGSADFRDGRSKLGDYLRDFDLWMVENNKTPCFYSLIDWLQVHHDASQLMSVIDGFEDDYEDTNACDGYYAQRKFEGYSTPKKSGKTSQKSTFECPICKSSTPHKVAQCYKLKKMTPKEREKLCYEQTLCLRCLQPGHLGSSCHLDRKKVCGVNGCTGKHHMLLHKDTSEKKFNSQSKQNRTSRAKQRNASHVNDEGHTSENTTSEEEEEKVEDGLKAVEQSKDSLNTKGLNTGKVSIQVGSIRVHYGKKSVIANILLDEGANNSNVNEELVDFMGMKTIRGPVNRTLNVMSGKKVNLSSNLVEFDISPIDPPESLTKYGVDAKTKFRIQAWTMKEVCGRSSLVDWQVQKHQFPHLKEVPVTRLNKKNTIDIVLGTNYAGLMAVLDSRIGSSLQDPVAHLTRLGWFIMGPSEKDTGGLCSIETNSLAFNSVESGSDENWDKFARIFWDSQEPELLPWHSKNPYEGNIDAVSPNRGQYDAVVKGEFNARNRKFLSEENQKAYEKMKVVYNDRGYYVASIPWKGEGKPNLTSNRSEVLKRQMSTLSPNYLKRKGVELPS